jgi:glycosyltransferase involved in cell wall biosynthesis
MKSVIMIAYNFPPEGNAGAHRPLRFVRHLPLMGWQPVVVTLATELYERYDPSLLMQVPAEVEVIRVRSRDPWLAFQERRALRIQKKISNVPAEKAAAMHKAHQSPLRSFLRQAVRKVEACYYHPDSAMGWIRPAVATILELCARRAPNVIWATGGPWSSFIVAQRASRLTGVPFVLDFRDAWTLVSDPFVDKRPVWATLADRRTLYRLFKNAQAVIFRYETEAECYWRAYPGALDAERIHIIPNGFDGTVDDFKTISGEKCQILYSGTLADYRYDTLLQALSRLKQHDKVRAKRLRLVFVGEQCDGLYSEADRLDLADILVASPPVSHAEILKLQQESDALLMLEREPTVKGYELLAGAKLFSYLKAGRPIIGVLPDGEAKKILRRVGVSTIADVESPEEIVNVFDRVLRAWSEKSVSSLAPNPIECAAFSAEKQVATLVRALERSLPLEPFVPGSVDIPLSLRDEIGEQGWITSAERAPSLA